MADIALLLACSGDGQDAESKTSIRDLIEFFREKLSSKDEEERAWAALCLARFVEQDDRVDNLLVAHLDDEDSRFRVLCAVFLLRKSLHFRDGRFPDWLTKAVPALISGSDLPLLFFIHRERSDVVMMPAGELLDTFIGDEMYFAQSLQVPRLRGLGKDAGPRLETFLRDHRTELDATRARWTQWWKQHENLDAESLGRIIIKRNLSLLRDERPAVHRLAFSSMSAWTGTFHSPADPEACERWWRTNEAAMRVRPDAVFPRCRDLRVENRNETTDLPQPGLRSRNSWTAICAALVRNPSTCFHTVFLSSGHNRGSDIGRVGRIL